MRTEKYTPKLRQRIVDRDNGECQYPTYSEKRGWGKCGQKNHPECHHIIPQRQSKLSGDPEVNNSDNLITIGRGHHQVTIHPDMEETRRDYGRQKRLGIDKPDSYNHTFKKRDQKVKEGQKYWNTDFDAHFADVADERSHLMEERKDGFFIAGKKQK